MTPFQTYGQTAAPSNMVFPTAAYLQSSQNAAETRARGMEAMGKGIASGIGSAASGYMKYKETKSEVGAAEKSYETLKSFLPPEVSGQIDSQIESMNQDPDMSLRDKAAFWKQTKSFLGDAVGQAFQMQKQQKELDSAKERTLLGIQARAEELGNQPLPTGSGMVMPGAPFYDQGFGATQQQPQSSFGSSFKKRHFGGQ